MGLHNSFRLVGFSHKPQVHREGCSFLAYSWKRPAYSGAVLFTVVVWSFIAYSLMHIATTYPMRFNDEETLKKVMCYRRASTAIKTEEEGPLPITQKNNGGSFLLTIRVFLLTVELLCLQWDSVSKNHLDGLSARKLNCK